MEDFLSFIPAPSQLLLSALHLMDMNGVERSGPEQDPLLYLGVR